jgi:hypothetical protein
MGEEGGVEPSMGAPSAAKTGATRGRSRTSRRREHLLPLLPRRRAAASFVFLPTDEPRHRTSPTPALRPVATKVRMTTSLPLWTPRPSSRGGTCRRSAPPLVMPAFVPGWVNSFAGAAAFVDARSLSGLAYPSRCRTSCRAARVRDAAPCRSRSRSRSRA